jgi:uncharacterized protein YfeS
MATPSARQLRVSGERQHDLVTHEPDEPASLGLETEPKHPVFAQHFTDPIYDDPANEFAPFGNDEGADTLADWTARVDELGAGSTVRMLLEDWGAADLDAAALIADGDVDSAMFAVGAAFTLLRLAGRIDPEGVRFALRGMEVVEDRYEPVPEVQKMRSDLIAFTGAPTR